MDKNISADVDCRAGRAHMVTSSLLLFIFTLFLNAPAVHSLQPSFIKGTIYSSYNNSVISGATISTTAGFSTQATSGAFYLRVPPNVYSLIVSAPGYCSNLLSGILAAPGQTATVSIWLTPASTETGYVEGRIIDAGTMSPVPGAFILTDLGGIATSSADGYFKMISPSGPAEVTAAAQNFSSKTINAVLIEPRRSAKLVISIKKSPSGSVPVKGSVRNACLGAKINDAKILSTTGDIAVSSSGEYSTKTKPGTSTLLASAAGYQYSYKTIVLSALPVGTLLNFSLIPSQNGFGLLQGTLTNSITQEAVAGARLETDRGAISFSRSDGTFYLFTSICTSRVTVSRDGFATHQAPAAVSFNSSTALNMFLEPLGIISGHAADSTDNHTINGAAISLIELPEISAASSDNGSYALKNIPPGTYTVTASHRCYEAVQREVFIETGTILQENFLLPPLAAGVMEGYITDKITGRPIEKARISCDHGASAEADATGFYSLALPACQTTVSVDADGYFTRTKKNIVILDSNVFTFDAALVPCLFCDFLKGLRSLP